MNRKLIPYEKPFAMSNIVIFYSGADRPSALCYMILSTGHATVNTNIIIDHRVEHKDRLHFLTT